MILTRKSPFSNPLRAVSPRWRGEKQAGFCTSAPILCKIWAIFRHFFASTPPSVSTPNFQKSTPFENLALTFFSRPLPFFAKNKHKHLYSNYLAKPLKTRVFSVKKFLAQNFQNLEGVEVFFFGTALTKFQKQGD
ncbi:MAG: hypothetical protein IJV45_10950 [Prevotella sp.]|nr:hypothetical protein [Prevotella sp.]MBQ9669239.1 hypothetical protein [Prevotella sp.]